MSRNFCVPGAILFVCGSCYAQAPSSDVQVPSITNSSMKLEDSTPVILRTKQELSSATAKVGDRVPFRVVEDVRVGDLVVIRRGADAWGVVGTVKPKAHKGHPGSIDVSIQSVQLVTGESAPLRAEQRSKGQSRTGEMGINMAQLAVATAGVGLPLLPLMMLEKGRDAYLPEGTKVTAYLNGDMALDQATLERAQPLLEHRTGPATLIVFRPHSLGTAYHPAVYCGKVALARLPDGSYLKTQLVPGKYFFRSNDDQVVELQLEEGREIYIQLEMTFHGLKAKGHLVQVSSSEGEDEIVGLRQLSEKDVAKVSDTSLAELQANPKEKQR